MQQRTQHNEVKERLFKVTVVFPSMNNRVKGRKPDDKRLRSDRVITKLEFIL